MKRSLLFPSGFKIIGFILLIPGLILIYFFLFQNETLSILSYGLPKAKYAEFNWVGRDNLTDEIAITLIVPGLIFIGFSRLTNESQSTKKIRLKALYSSIFANCLLTALFYILDTVVSQRGLLFNLILYQLFFLLPIFILRFYYLLHQFKKDNRRQSLYLLPYMPFNLIGKIVSLTCVLVSIGFLLWNITEPRSILLVSITGVFFWIWSKEKRETKAIAALRLKAMQVAVYINYALLLVTTWVFYGFDYLAVLLISLVSIQAVFLIVFYWMIFYAAKHRQIHVAN